MAGEVVLGHRRLDLQRMTESAVQLLQGHHERADVAADTAGGLSSAGRILPDFQFDRIPFAVEDETQLESGVAALADPRVDKDADIFARHRENGLGECGGGYQHGRPLICLAFLLRRLNGQRQLFVKNLKSFH